jgi:hypothetical protein
VEVNKDQPNVEIRAIHPELAVAGSTHPQLCMSETGRQVVSGEGSQ